ncbi:tRNA lysidine(34) synthetase TilS [bacterium CG_4_10_14_0_2_um_filter_33_32]|nr:MAG: tRNA lysidine(34) synthetase TilS [bacterium CG2_30_33_46]PIR67290.1 MAG: tRNA lysidine(34) synthetase TilS [bacterium CG10_big_fil_rev_8_21_14_0_10_33_18]PIU76617.1 MAG: tRNA lysidine(34) synthetase TilS [bacterium CG06_land_8_20_14_3_00_33_50]PIW81106.1 MAG: tRNA lysidine(34) synthetase TilS [bacterium CG_4_8_14_3_um_filter_33_28]PIY85130.1 MAG: tRNA lysidine(34) synthetase TilS [bacterium CG_4_10_14_0_8_um_filter_33_57]PIZ86680.1 MAG: tRNA lysidine(34) synthetase TilS [bacterium CG_
MFFYDRDLVNVRIIMMDLINKVQQNIIKRKLFDKKEKIILAISGGIDSIVLLDILHNLKQKYQFSIIIAHLNHGLRGKDADLDQKFVQEIAIKHGYRFETKKVNIKKISEKRKGNLEEIAREERYKFFNSIAKKNNINKIITAHHADDQIETVLLNFIRGAKSQGLSGMDFITRRIINKYEILVVRPMLNFWRKDIERYQKEHNLKFRLDKSNYDLRIRRNYLRHKLIPSFEKEDKNFKYKVFAKSILLRRLIKETESKIFKLYKKIEKKKLLGAVILDRNIFRKIDYSLKALILKEGFRQVSGSFKNISSKNIHDSLNLIESSEVGKMMILPGKLILLIDYDDLILFKDTLPKTKIKKRKLRIGKNVIKEADLFIKLSKKQKISANFFNYDFQKIELPIFIRSFMPGDRFVPLGFNGTKKVQDLFVDLKIPKRLRNLIPIIVDKNDKILGALGIRQGNLAVATKTTKKFLAIDFNKLSV